MRLFAGNQCCHVGVKWDPKISSDDLIFDPDGLTISQHSKNFRGDPALARTNLSISEISADSEGENFSLNVIDGVL